MHGRGFFRVAGHTDTQKRPPEGHRSPAGLLRSHATPFEGVWGQAAVLPGGGPALASPAQTWSACCVQMRSAVPGLHPWTLGRYLRVFKLTHILTASQTSNVFFKCIDFIENILATNIYFVLFRKYFIN